MAVAVPLGCASLLVLVLMALAGARPDTDGDPTTVWLGSWQQAVAAGAPRPTSTPSSVTVVTTASDTVATGRTGDGICVRASVPKDVTVALPPITTVGTC